MDRPGHVQHLSGRAGEGANKEPDEEKAETLRKLLDAFIVTLVYGQEFAPLNHPDYLRLNDLEPIRELEKLTSDAVAKALARRENAA